MTKFKNVGIIAKAKKPNKDGSERFYLKLEQFKGPDELVFKNGTFLSLTPPRKRPNESEESFDERCGWHRFDVVSVENNED
jgi:hypothetical protein